MEASEERLKKRKRASNAPDSKSRPSKKLAQTPSEAEISFRFIDEKHEWAPVLATSSGLILPESLSFNPYIKTHQIPSMPSTGRITAISASELLLHSSEHRKIDYIARERPRGSIDTFMKHYIGIYDPKSRQVQFVEARRADVQSTLRHIQLERRDGEEEASKEPVSRLEARKTLDTAFGTKKSQQAIQSMTKNAIGAPRRAGLTTVNADGTASPTISAAASVILSGMAANGTVLSRTALQAITDEFKPRPPANLAATIPSEVYTLVGLVGREILGTLDVHDWIKKTANKQAIETHSHFVSGRVERLASSTGEAAADAAALKGLRFLLVMLEWFWALEAGKLRGRKIGRRREVEDAMRRAGEAPTLADELAKRFSDGGPAVSSWHMDKFFTTACALALVLAGGDIELKDLALDLRMDQKSLSKYFKEIGARVSHPTPAERSILKLHSASEAATHWIAKLRLPLQFPKQRILPLKRK